MKTFVVAGIGTGVGKTIISAILVKALKADYWKPIQAGDLDHSDSLTVQQLADPGTVIHPEAYRLKNPLSPHRAAEMDGIEIDTKQIRIPPTSNQLIIELAGGLMVPLSRKTLNIDLLKAWQLPVVLVSQNYLGSINHTLLSVASLKDKEVPIAGIIFNGEENASTEDFILDYCGVKCIGKIRTMDITPDAIISAAATLVPYLNRL
jgi:dethiobiotin synthetase